MSVITSEIKLRTKSTDVMLAADLVQREIAFEQEHGRICVKDELDNLLFYLQVDDLAVTPTSYHTWSSSRIREEIDFMSIPTTIDLQDRHLLMKTLESGGMVLADMLERELMFSREQTSMFIRSNNELLQFASIDDNDWVSRNKTWSAHKIAYEILNRAPTAHTHTIADIEGFDLSVRDLFSTTAPLTYDSVTGIYSIPKATSIVSGYISSTDWATFNNKQNPLGFTPENKAYKDQNNGYCGLDAMGIIAVERIPDIPWSIIIDGPSSLPEDIDDAVSLKHTHTNLTVLDNTEESFTTVLKNMILAGGQGHGTSASIKDHADVDSTMSPVDEQYLMFNGTHWTAMNVIFDKGIRDLNDVNPIFTPYAGQVLGYNGSYWDARWSISSTYLFGASGDINQGWSLNNVFGVASNLAGYVVGGICTIINITASSTSGLETTFEIMNNATILGEVTIAGGDTSISESVYYSVTTYDKLWCRVKSTSTNVATNPLVELIVIYA